MKSAKTLVALVACAGALAGCATDPYYDRYAYESSAYGARTYDDRYYDERYVEAPRYRYYDGPVYYTPYPYYVAPSVGFSFGYSSGSRWHHRR
jgi:hypothetical protein